MEDGASSAELSKTLTKPKLRKVLLIILSILVFLGFIILLLVLYTWDRGKFTKGVILEIPIGQLSVEEAESKLEQLSKDIHQRPLHLVSGEKNFQINLEELGLTYTYDEPLQKAYLIGREGNLFDKAISKYKASWGISFQPDYHWDDQVLAETLTKHLLTLNIPAEDAHFSVNSDNSLVIVPEKPGKKIDLDSLIASIKKQAPNNTEMIEIPLKEVTPTLTKKELENVKLNNLLSEYTTYFDPNQKERTFNIMLATKAIDATVLKSKEVFSFNRTVGPRTAQAGYQEAMIIEGNTFVPGLGGGVCQVSSTLYNSVRMASPSLSVIERSRHSLPVTYVPSGQDATVAFPTLDFKFRNDTEGFLLIRCDVKGNSVTFSIFECGA